MSGSRCGARGSGDGNGGAHRAGDGSDARDLGLNVFLVPDLDIERPINFGTENTVMVAASVTAVALLVVLSRLLEGCKPYADSSPVHSNGHCVHQSERPRSRGARSRIGRRPPIGICSRENIEEFMQKIKPVKYGEEVCFNVILMLKASSSGLEHGNCVWTIKGPRASIT